MYSNLKPTKRELRDFGFTLTARRSTCCMSKAQLAKEVRCSFQTIDNIEHGRQWPSLHLYRAICRVLRAGKLPMFEEAA